MPFALSQLLGTLTVVWVLTLSESEFTPGPPSPLVYDVQVFGVGQGTEEFLPLNPQSVALPPELSHKRFDYGQIWQEPAISGLDWLFTPIHKLEKQLHLALLQASTPFNRRFTLPMDRSTGFGSHPSD